MSNSPLPNGSNGRDSRGRFGKGNPGGPGNPYANRTAVLRKVLIEAIKEEDVAAIAAAIVAKAKEGDVVAAKLVFGYAAGSQDRAYEGMQAELDADQQRLKEEEAEILRLIPREKLFEYLQR